MHVLREIYDFITGGSIVSPIAVACALAAAFWLPAARVEAFLALAAIGFVASTFEKPT